jgi:hypothetical protein
MALLCLSGSARANPAACSACHPAEYARHAAGMHARALRPASNSHAAALFDRPVRDRTGFEFRYTPTTQGLAVQAQNGDDKASALIEWIFGAGVFAFTPVGRHNGKYFEHRVSWYSASQRPGMTLGHPARTPLSAVAALGQPQSANTIYGCFNCHATGVKPGPDLSAMQPGIQCERCHGPAEAHVKAPSVRNIVKLSGLSPVASIRVCAECHRMPETKRYSAAPEKDDPMSIRFAPVGLMASRCFQTGGALKCTTCHDPHGGPRPVEAAYVKVCQNCHAPAQTVASRCSRAENTSCLGCHMRKATPVPDLTFTDHRIRVYPALLTN